MNLNEFFSVVYADNITHDFYVDGSYNTSTYVYGSGIVHVVNGEVQYKKSLTGNNLELAKQRNVAGEIRASMGAIAYAVKMGLKDINSLDYRDFSIRSDCRQLIIDQSTYTTNPVILLS